MGALTLHPATAPAPPWWDALADILTFSRRQSRDFWAALSASTDPRLRALIFRCGQHEAYLKTQRLDMLRDGATLTTFLAEVWTPHVMVRALEALHGEGRLSRRDCTVLQGKFLAHTDRDGRWTITHKKVCW
jgi:hypothetical protein